MRGSIGQPRNGRQPGTSPDAAAKVAALQAALAAEQAASYGYGVVGAHLTGANLLQATTDWITHQRARDFLTGMISALGARPHAAAVAYQLPITVRTATDAVALAVILEHQVTAAYLGLVALADPALRADGAKHMQAAAVRAAHWNGRSQAFPGLPASALRAGRGGTSAS